MVRLCLLWVSPLLLSLLFAFALPSALADGECGPNFNNRTCAAGYCCSTYGYCGTTSIYCCESCASQCDYSKCSSPPPPYQPPPPPPPPPPYVPPPPPSGESVSSIITKELFEYMLLHRAETANGCVGGFYTYEAFIEAADSFAGFGTTGDSETRKRELAAFFGQTSQETTGGWDNAPDGRYAWGYCFVSEGAGDYCDPREEWPCVSGKQYYGRGPIQLSYNYNYGPAGAALGYDLLSDPDKVAEDPVMSFKTAIWFWMTAQSPKPSCHEVMTGQWTPSEADIAANRLPGYGVTTNIINGGVECGKGDGVETVKHRIGFYERYCGLLDVSMGDNLDCYYQKPFNAALAVGLQLVSSE
ncbi:PREDICTED: basic endochitinase-like [Nelumbo nucifera]|uniref:chitinase n=1 Tax=Nelumbo nucifera TaxID=4432 RepID=A0A1U8B0L6_NELNU|nr:PREDICTED: basic endochitinase-like [Nelumbo nucifera]